MVCGKIEPPLIVVSLGSVAMVNCFAEANNGTHNQITQNMMKFLMLLMLVLCRCLMCCDDLR
jgi:hypothetical protein